MAGRRKIDKYPLLYGLAEEALVQGLNSKNDDKQPLNMKLQSNRYAQEFLDYIRSAKFPVKQEQLHNVNEIINHQYVISDKDKTHKQQHARNILQSLSFGLTPEQACEIFPNTMQSVITYPQDYYQLVALNQANRQEQQVEEDAQQEKQGNQNGEMKEAKQPKQNKQMKEGKIQAKDLYKELYKLLIMQ